MDIGTVLPLLRDVLGSGVSILSSRLLKEMQDYWIWEVQTQSPRLHLIVKLAGPRAAYTSAFEHTAALHRLVQSQTSIPAPEVVAADESYQKFPWRYFIKTYLPGQDWATVAKEAAAKDATAPGTETATLHKARFQLGEAVALLHQIHFPGFGELDHRAEVSEPLPYLDALAQRIRRMIPSADSQDFIFSMLSAHSALFQDSHIPALCHEDLHHFNILLNEKNGEWSLGTILDFEKAWAGEREIDLARMDLWRMTSEPFWDAYLERCPLDVGYADRKAIYQLIWCLEYAEDSTKHLADTQSLCRSLGLPIIESFEPFRASKR